MIESINNARARMAYDFVEEIKQANSSNSSNSSNLQKEFRTLARSFPTMVQVNGVGTAIAYLYSKKGNKTVKEQACKKLLEALEKWIFTTKVVNTDKNHDLLKTITNGYNENYRTVTQEVMAYMQWIKRFSEGMLEG